MALSKVGLIDPTIDPVSIRYAANVTGNASVTRSLAVGFTDGRVPQANLDVKGNTYISGATTIAGAATLSSTATITGKLTSSSVTPAFYGANVTGNVSVTRSLAVGFTDGRVPQANLDVKGNTYISGVTTASTFEPTGDTSTGDDAAIGYTSVEGLILTGQGSTSDITLKNDADGTVFTVPTGTDDILFPDSAMAMWGTSSDLQIYHDASDSYITDNGTGNLKIGSGNQVDILGTAETLATFVDDGAVSLYHNNGVKIATTATGAAITGTILATTDTDTSNTGSVTLDFAANQNFILTFTGNVTLDNPTTEQVGQAGVIVCIQDGTGSRTLSLGTDYETAASGGITLSTAASAVDVIPYFVKAAGSIQLGAVQLAFG